MRQRLSIGWSYGDDDMGYPLFESAFRLLPRLEAQIYQGRGLRIMRKETRGHRTQLQIHYPFGCLTGGFPTGLSDDCTSFRVQVRKEP